ncbi:hypothetical protein GS444_08000 [Rhodococcus hoagii]|nr:hypothetical protein [Prescottella equi]
MNERDVGTGGDNAEQSWHAGGLCRTNPDLFFPETRERAKSAQAVSICMTCPYARRVEHSLRKPGAFGIWADHTHRTLTNCVGKLYSRLTPRPGLHCKPGLFGASTCSSCAKSPRRVARDALRVGVFLDGEAAFSSWLQRRWVRILSTQIATPTPTPGSARGDQDLRRDLRAVEIGVPGDQLKQPRQYGYGPVPGRYLRSGLRVPRASAPARTP